MSKFEEENVDWKTFLKVMIEDEKAAIQKYQLAVEKASSEQLKTALERLLYEEQVHIDLLEEEIRRLETV